jgi:REP element-mobilizing transposase RayT
MRPGLIEVEVMPDHVRLRLDCDTQFGIDRLARSVKRPRRTSCACQAWLSCFVGRSAERVNVRAPGMLIETLRRKAAGAAAR